MMTLSKYSIRCHDIYLVENLFCFFTNILILIEYLDNVNHQIKFKKSVRNLKLYEYNGITI